MSRRHYHHGHHFEWWLAPVYATVFMFQACYWMLKLYTLMLICAWKGGVIVAQWLTAAFRSWRAGTLGTDVRRKVATLGH